MALEAHHAAELESRPYPSTIPCPPPDEVETGKFREYAQEARVYLHACTLKGEVDRLVSYLAGKINGVEVDIAQLQPMAPHVDALLAGQKRLEEQTGAIMALLREVRANQQIIASTVIDQGTAIGELQARFARFRPGLESVAPDSAREAE